MDQVFGKLQAILIQLTQIADAIWPFTHPKAVVVALLDNSIGLLLKVWFKFILGTVDFETGGAFIRSAAIQRFEPKVQIVANAGLVLIALWASYRIMWGHGLRSQYTARILLPRLFMGVVLVNFALPLMQAAIEASNNVCGALQTFAVFDSPSTWWSNFAHDPNAGTWEIITTAALAAGYDALAVTYVVRYAILIVLAITAPIAGLLFMLPETHHLSKQWTSHFTTNLLMQPAQLFVLSIGFTLEQSGITPVHHLFALAALVIVFKVPGALGGAEKAAHKLESTISMAFRHIEHAMVKV